jgi:cellulose biosynthesis protein BcsQ
MTLANTAWVLASQGNKVLVIDWDLEAPGLHRYLHPFLEDKELSASPGVIDYAVDFVTAGRAAARSDPDATATSEPWHEPFTSLLRYTYSIGWDFGDGTLDLVPAGQQGQSYALQVNHFDWKEFYRVGGGVLLEGLKRNLREQYDYVLIDSRTGISDTSGICTVQMPDDIVVCFTLNQQSIKGAAAVAESADAQRRRENGEPTLRIWPLVTRVELSEKERLDGARANARDVFQRYLRHLPRTERADYWGLTEILYQPFYAYEEVLAVFAEQRRHRASMLTPIECLAGYLTNGAVKELRPLDEAVRLRGLQEFNSVHLPVSKPPLARSSSGAVFLAYPREDENAVFPIAKYLRLRFGEVVWWDIDSVLPGDDFEQVLGDAADRALVILAFFGPGWLTRDATFSMLRAFERQLQTGLLRGKILVPVLVGSLDYEGWRAKLDYLDMRPLTRIFASRITEEATSTELHKLGGDLERILARSTKEGAATGVVDPDDPNKGQWGGSPATRNRLLRAEVRELSPGWYEVALEVLATHGPPLAGAVQFHLHPSFKPSSRHVSVESGRATLRLSAWGAFTVGATLDDGQTMLELDLSNDPAFPAAFRLR